MSVLILGPAADEHAAHVREQLQRRGAEVHLVDTADFPQRLQVSFDPASGWGGLTLPSGDTICFDAVTAVYWRSYGPLAVPQLPNPEQSRLAQNDARGLFESLLIRIPARWVNGWVGWQLHQTKPAALARVAALGAEVPNTVVTNNPAVVREFVRNVGRVIFKPVQGGAHARRLTPELLSQAALERLAIAPVTLQEEIEGTNIRTFVAGERVLSCEIETDAVDFRDDPQPLLRVHQLPPGQAERSREIARELQLAWAGIDYRRTPDGRYVFLEANPSPMFLGFEEQTGLPLTEALLELLIG